MNFHADNMSEADRHKGVKKKRGPYSIAVQRLGSGYKMSTQGIILDMCSGVTYKSPHPGDGWSIAHFTEINTVCSPSLIHGDKPTKKDKADQRRAEQRCHILETTQ